MKCIVKEEYEEVEASDGEQEEEEYEEAVVTCAPVVVVLSIRVFPPPFCWRKCEEHSSISLWVSCCCICMPTVCEYDYLCMHCSYLSVCVSPSMCVCV